MCGRYTLTEQPGALARFFDLAGPAEIVARYNIAPTQPVVAIRRQGGERRAGFMRWGLVPGWVKDPRDFPLLVNARAETMAEKPAFRDVLRNARCILPATGYYEWQTLPDRAKQPFYITLESGAPMALAALGAVWTGPEGEEIESVATITVPANRQLSAMHDRMPALLVGEALERWLDPATGPAEAAALARPLPDGALRVHPVSRRVNSARDDDPGLVTPVTPEPPAQQSLAL